MLHATQVCPSRVNMPSAHICANAGSPHVVSLPPITIVNVLTCPPAQSLAVKRAYERPPTICPADGYRAPWGPVCGLEVLIERKADWMAWCTRCFALVGCLVPPSGLSRFVRLRIGFRNTVYPDKNDFAAKRPRPWGKTLSTDGPQSGQESNTPLFSRNETAQ